VKPPVAVKPPKAAREPKAPKPAPPPFDGVAQPTQDCIRVVNAYARAHSLSTEAKDAIIQDAVSRAQGDRRATHEHALLSVDALSDKNKVARIDRTQFLNPAEKAAWAALQGGAAWDSLDKRGRAGAQYFGLCDENGVIAK
jgi:hypothetical protein